MNFNLCDESTSDGEHDLTIFYIKKKQIDVSFLCVCPVIDNAARHNIVKVFWGSTRLSHGFTATLTVMTKFMLNNRTDAWTLTSIC